MMRKAVKNMTEAKVFADNFSCIFRDPGDFFCFLKDREDNSEWLMSPSRDLRFSPLEKGSPAGNLFMQLNALNGSGDVLIDTMENTGLLMEVNGESYPVRSCALKSVLERARISGNALSKLKKSVFAEILNYCMGIATGDSLIKIADAKVSAVHGGDPKDYAKMEMLDLFEHVFDYLNCEFPGHHFITAHFDHAMVTAIWRLDGQANQLMDTYKREVAAKGLDPNGIVPALRFSTSDVGMGGANLYPIFFRGSNNRIVPLGYPIKTEHRYGVDLDYFDKQLRLLYARFGDAIKAQMRLLDIEIRYPCTTLLGVLKKIGAPKKYSYDAADNFMAINGDTPCTAYELYLQMSEVIFEAQCDGVAGIRIAQLEETIARALRVAWSDFDRPGEFKW